VERRRRALLADVLGLLAILLVLLDYFRPALLSLPTIAAGGDTQCHYPTAVYFQEYLLLSNPNPVGAGITSLSLVYTAVATVRVTALA